MFTQGFEFKKVEITNARQSNGRRLPKTVYMSYSSKKDGKEKWSKVGITSDLAREAGFKPGDRVDLLQCGTMFAFKKEPAGLLKLTESGNSVIINSTNLCIHLRAETKQCTEFDGFVENGMVIFKPRK